MGHPDLSVTSRRSDTPRWALPPASSPKKIRTWSFIGAVSGLLPTALSFYLHKPDVTILSAKGWHVRWRSRHLSLAKISLRQYPNRTRIILAAIGFVFLFSLVIPRNTNVEYSEAQYVASFETVSPGLPPNNGKPDPVEWLEQNSNNRHAISHGFLSHLRGHDKPRAALISLVRNSELDGMIQSMKQLEARFNRKYSYPWVFFNDEPFTDEFKAATKNLTFATCYYEIVPEEHWSMPDWIDEGRFLNSLEYLGTIGVGKGWMMSYHNMCRWNSGFFYKHPRLKYFDWYWRVEPNVQYYCDINYDVFRFMRDNNLKYGFNMNILDDARSFPSLWSRTRAFASANPHLIHPESDLNWLLDPHNGNEYNNCQFFSNFEIGNLNFWRGEANEKYFEWIDKGGGFYYERFGDAPVHTLSVAMFVPKSEIWFFRDIGYQHDINDHCPPHSDSQCSCELTTIDENFYKLVPFQSRQKKPEDTCIRQFLGGDWLKKKDGWNKTAEVAYGGDGYHGYEFW